MLIDDEIFMRWKTMPGLHLLSLHISSNGDVINSDVIKTKCWKFRESMVRPWNTFLSLFKSREVMSNNIKVYNKKVIVLVWKYIELNSFFWCRCPCKLGQLSQKNSFNTVYSHTSAITYIILQSHTKPCFRRSCKCSNESVLSKSLMPRPYGSVVSVSGSWPGIGEFNPQLRWIFFPA